MPSYRNDGMICWGKWVFLKLFSRRLHVLGTKEKWMSEKFDWLLFGWTFKNILSFTKYGIFKKEKLIIRNQDQALKGVYHRSANDVEWFGKLLIALPHKMMDQKSAWATSLKFSTWDRRVRYNGTGSQAKLAQETVIANIKQNSLWSLSPWSFLEIRNAKNITKM